MPKPLPRAVLKQAVEQIRDETCTVMDIVRKTGAHPNTVQREIAMGRLPAFRIQRQCLVWRDDADAWAKLERRVGRPRSR